MFVITEIIGVLPDFDNFSFFLLGQPSVMHSKMQSIKVVASQDLLHWRSDARLCHTPAEVSHLPGPGDCVGLGLWLLYSGPLQRDLLT